MPAMAGDQQGLQHLGPNLQLRHGCGVVVDLDSAAPAAVFAPSTTLWQVRYHWVGLTSHYV